MTLAELERAATARRTAETQYRSAVLTAARTHGVTLTADTLGISRQAVRQLVARARERLSELDASLEAAIADTAAGYVLSDQGARHVTAKRNAEARKRRARGLAPLPSLKSDALRHAESQILAALREGLAVDGLTAQDVDEAQALRQAIGGGLSDDDGIPW